MKKVLIIDDDRDLRNVCTVGLEVLGYEVLTASNAHDGLAQVAVRMPDVIVLDLGLPDMDGIELCRRIRIWSDVPVVVLSADGTENRKVDALGDGADDYMTKPFSMRELDARLQVALRHHASAAADASTLLDAGPLHFDLSRYEATFHGRPLELTPKEFDFLAYLARNAGKVCTRRMILESIWGPHYAGQTHYLKVYAYRIRRKLHDEAGHFLHSEPSVGYRLVLPDSPGGEDPRQAGSHQ